MKHKLTKSTEELIPLERDILASARDDGMIPFPQGPARLVEGAFRAMNELANLGYLEYVRRTWYRAYWLTTKGWRLVRNLQGKIGPHQSSAFSHHSFNHSPRTHHV